MRPSEVSDDWRQTPRSAQVAGSGGLLKMYRASGGAAIESGETSIIALMMQQTLSEAPAHDMASYHAGQRRLSARQPKADLYGWNIM